ncbi:MAG TPA: hypothetical protein VFS42_09435 [Burkholderiaceae bacterium]|nr:hypothetical protein [Burkholderiaceae bacterium]
MLTIAGNSTLSDRHHSADPGNSDDVSEGSRSNQELPHGDVVAPRDMTSDQLNALNRAERRARLRAAAFAGVRVALATAASSGLQYSAYRSEGLQDQNSPSPSLGLIFVAASVGGVTRQLLANYFENFGPRIVNPNRQGLSRYHDDASTLLRQIKNVVFYLPSWCYVPISLASGLAAGFAAKRLESQTAPDVYRGALIASWLFEGLDGFTSAYYESSRSGAAIVEQPILHLPIGWPRSSTAASTFSHSFWRMAASALTSMTVNKAFAGKSLGGFLSLARTTVEKVGALNGLIRGGWFLYRGFASELTKKYLVEPSFKRMAEEFAACSWHLNISPVAEQHIENADPTAPRITAVTPRAIALETIQEATDTSIDIGQLSAGTETARLARRELQAIARAEQLSQMDDAEFAQPFVFETLRPITPGINNREVLRI